MGSIRVMSCPLSKSMTSSAVQMGAAHGKVQQAPDKQPMNAVDIPGAAVADAPLESQQITDVAHQNADMTMTLAYASNGAAESAAPVLAPGQPDISMDTQSVASALLITGNGGKVVQPVAELSMSPEVPSLEPDKDPVHPDSMQASLAAPNDGIADSSGMQQPEAHDLAAAPEQPRLSAEQVLFFAITSVHMHGLSYVHYMHQREHVYMADMPSDSFMQWLSKAVEHRT